jgi:DHA1 family bicyclomycin/chloramphenicol resistance-like MFS transporter
MNTVSNKRWLLAHLILLGAFGPMTTDMYLPALPRMVDQLNSNVGLVSLTLVLFFMVFGAAMLIWGTLSDKYGRRPTLLVGITVYVVSSLSCALATNVYQLILFRAFQAIGSGAAMSISMAVIKDVFEGKARERALAISSLLMTAAPIIAPIIGAGILKFLSWRGIFVVLSGMGTIALLGTLRMKESASGDSQKGLMSTLGNLPKLLKNPGFSIPLVPLSFLNLPGMMFLGASSYIYIGYFGLSEQAYSLYFAANALFLAFGPFIFLVLRNHTGVLAIFYLAFLLICFSGLLTVLLGQKSPLLFALAVGPSTLASSMSRAPGANLLLTQGKEDAGAASSLMSFTFLFIGSLGMQFIALGWDNRIFVFGLLSLSVGTGCLLFWPFTWRKCNPSGPASSGLPIGP